MGFSLLLLVVQVHGADTDCFVNVRGWSHIIRSGIEKLEEVDTTYLSGLQKTLPILLIVQENLLMSGCTFFCFQLVAVRRESSVNMKRSYSAVKDPMARVHFFHFSDLVVECVLIIFLKT